MQPFDLFLFVVIYAVGAAVLFFMSRILRRAGEAANQARTANRLIAGLWIWPVFATVYAFNTGTDILWFAVSFVIPFASVSV